MSGIKGRGGVKGRSGGARVGAGRKPLSRSDRWLGGRPLATVVSPVTGSVHAADVPMPDDLPDPVAAWWMRLAPLAIEEQTLTPTVAVAFVALCELQVLQEEMSTHPMRRGSADHLRVLQRLEMGMARFRLTADGRPRAAAAPKVDLTPLQQLQAAGAQLRAVK